MQIPIDKKAKAPLYRQMAEFIQQQISAGNLPPGSILPSIRSMAQRHMVSKTIVSMAYAELNALGLVEGRIGQGTVVTASMQSSKQRTYLLPDLSSTASITHDLLHQGARPGNINFAANMPSPDHYPLTAFSRCLKSIMAEDLSVAFQYESSTGYGPLRSAIAHHLMDQGIIATQEEIMITAGAQQAISLVINELVRPGECVVVESPCYMGALEVCAGYGVRVVPLSVANGGLNMEEVEDVFKRIRPRLLYTMPTYQNPTGVTMNLEHRRRLVELASAYDVYILEDGVFSEIQFNPPHLPALYALGGPVVHCSSFSKALFPDLRIGYIVAPPELIRRLSYLKQAVDHANPGLLQRALTRFLDQGYFEAHLRHMLPIYRQRRDAAITALHNYMPDGVEWTEPEGGMAIWIRCPTQVDTLTLYLEALQAGVGFAPGNVFYAANSPSNYLRLSYGVETPQRIEQGIAILANLIRIRLKHEITRHVIV